MNRIRIVLLCGLAALGATLKNTGNDLARNFRQPVRVTVRGVQRLSQPNPTDPSDPSNRNS